MRAAVPIGFLALLVLPACAGSPEGVGSITPGDLAARLEAGEAPVVLDVRTPGEYGAGHIPGAINIPHDELAARIAEVEPYREREIVVHCKSGVRAARAEAVLLDADFEHVLHLEGDIAGWQSDGHPLE